MARYIDLSGAPAEVKSEFFALAQEADQARREATAQHERAAAHQRRSTLAVLIAAVVGGLLGFWRGRRGAAAARIRVRASR